jgi:predicted nucleic acid-binding protein
MASEAAAGQPVAVESDFLFGLRKSDTRHRNVITALEMHENGKLAITLLPSAILEVRAVLYSRGLKGKDVEEVFSLMAALLAQYGVGEVSTLNLSDVIVAEKMRSDEPDLTFFDSLHAATSKRLGTSLLSSEGIYKRLGLAVIDLDKLKKQE